MKKNLFLRLCLATIALLSINSCRQDNLHEQETYNNTSAFQLSSKRISLNEAQHKAKLLPEIEQVEKKFKAKTKSSAFGKLVNYANGVSIDTDDVIYIENGTGFYSYSYTFNIKHNNAPADAPVENLVLSPLADGTYRELLLTYNLTIQEKQMLESGISVDTHGKVIITELAQGTYSNGEILSRSNMSCEWVEEPSYSACSSNEHFNGEALVSQGGPCKATTPSQLYTVVTYRCTALPVDTSLGENGEGGGSGPQNGPGGLGSENPEEIPTMPNVPPKGSSCQKAINNNIKSKELLAEPKIAAAQTQLTSSLATDTNEKSFSFGKDAIGDYDTTPINTSTAGNQVGVQANNPTLAIEGGVHTHTIDLYNCFSAGDIYSLQGANSINPNFKTMFVFANGGVVYALTITDPVKYANFVTNNPAGMHLDMLTSHWKPTSPIYLNFEMAMAQFKNQGLSDDDAYATAIAFILNKYDMGATLSQKDATGNFNSMFVNENIINVNVGGVNVPISTYSQTTTCNLK